MRNGRRKNSPDSNDNAPDRLAHERDSENRQSIDLGEARIQGLNINRTTEQALCSTVDCLEAQDNED